MTESSNSSTPRGDGIVDGTYGDDKIDLAYMGDPHGDVIDGGDAKLTGEAPDDDIVNAGNGDDLIEAGKGDDEIYAGNGNDVVYGEAGDDVIYGDGDVYGSATSREVFQWDLAPDPDDGGAIDPLDNLSGGFTQDTGGVNVTFSVLSEDPGVATAFSGETQLVTGIDTGGPEADTASGLDSVANGAGNSAEYKLEFSKDVENVEFRINDIDGDGIVQVQAFDADGNPITVNLTAGANVTLQDNDTVAGADTGDSDGGYDVNDSADYSILVSIPGPVASLTITHSQDGADNSGITVTDVYFDAPMGDACNAPGDDELYGGDGDDTIFGDAGNDTITGGAGADRMYGGDDRDTFNGGNDGDVIDGGTGGDDFDTLNMGGQRFTITSQTVDADGDSTSGSIDLLDGDGKVTGSFTFKEIEKIVPCFTPGTLIATPRGERRVEDLKVGDRVITRDNGIQEIRWVGSRTLGAADLAKAGNLNPVMIRQGALGNGLPERDMLVSPNHRVLVANDKTALYFEDREVLVAAKHLAGLDGVEVVEMTGITYIHFLFDQHEVVLSDGTWTESFQPGDQTLTGLDTAQRNEIFEIFPELKTREGLGQYQSARRSLKKHEAWLLMH